MADRAPSRIIGVLRTGARATPELYDELAQEGYSRTSLKAATSRLASGGAIREVDLRLGKGAKIVFIDGRRPDHELLKRLAQRGFYGRPLVGSILETLGRTHPTVSRVDVAKLAAIPMGIADAPDWTKVDRFIEGLEQLGVLSKTSPRLGQECWTAQRSLLRRAGLTDTETDTGHGSAPFREKLRLGLTGALAEWLRKNAFVGFRAVSHATDERPVVSYLSFAFDVFGHTFASGVGNPMKRVPKGWPVVGDVLKGTCSEAYAECFVARVRLVRSVAKKLPLSFVLAGFFEPSALRILQESGVFPWTHSQLLGDKVAEAVTRMGEIADRLVREQNLDPQVFTEAFEGFDNFRTLFGSLKGKLFELVMAVAFSKRKYDCTVAWEAKDNTRSFDVDVLGVRSTEAVIVECKGQRRDSVVEAADVSRHFRDRAQLAREILMNERSRKIHTFRAIVACTCEFDPASVVAVDNGVFGSKANFTFELWDRSRVLRELQSDGLSELSELLDRYFV